MDALAAIEAALGRPVTDIAPLGGGCVGQVYRVSLADGEQVVAKLDERQRPTLVTEAYMLRYLAENSRLPVPSVLFAADRLLILEQLPGNSQFGWDAQRHAAELLADLHDISAAAYGLDQDTLIGGLHQPNSWMDSWLNFFRERRLLYMGEEGVRAGRLPGQLLTRLRRFSERLDEWLMEPDKPSLIHGDVWTTNVLAQDGHITGFIDPAIYYAHAEIELAFSTLFGTFGDEFFGRYVELRPIADGFFETRRDIYNLYPLLVHVRIFGGSYVNSVNQILRRFGH
jgi:fructosamine-3-kinase